jgi:hypothetical protein
MREYIHRSALQRARERVARDKPGNHAMEDGLRCRETARPNEMAAATACANGAALWQIEDQQRENFWSRRVSALSIGPTSQATPRLPEGPGPG